MSTNDTKEKELFAQALAFETPEQRAAFLHGACGDCPELRQRIEALLEGHDRAGGFLQDSPGATLGSEKPGDKIGHYRLREQIGEGGCGVVYVAQQEEPVRRKVALKVIKLGMDTRQVVARFEAEKQALALMDHPNIAKVLDAGTTESGRPYFVMELVRGNKITDYCDTNALTTEERLNLFIQVCSAVQHAHQKGIIHRDIKPSNILVTLHDGVPVPKVIDFGIAKATSDQRLTDKTIYTAFEQFIGTPAYMSPEQAEMSGLDIDIRTDIYSLGVLLYELLAGSPPFDPQELAKAGLDEVRRTIRDKEPPRPSTRLSHLSDAELTTVAKRHHEDAPRLIHSLRGDLDWIVMKALEKDRTRRYEDVAAFGQDLKRYLASEPVTARPPSTIYRLKKTIRRNKTLAALVSVLTLTLAGWIIILLGIEKARIAQNAKETEARNQIEQRRWVDEAQVTRLTARSAGWSQHAWTSVSKAARIQASGGSDDVRDQAAAVLAGLDVHQKRVFTNFDAFTVLFDRQGERLLMGSPNSGARLWDGTPKPPIAWTNTQSLARLAFVGGDTPVELDYDSTGKCFSTTNLMTSRQIRTWPVPSNLEPRMKSERPLKGARISLDGSEAAAVLRLSEGNEAIVVFGSASPVVLSDSATNIAALTISEDGSYVAAVETGGPITIWRADNIPLGQIVSGRNQILSLALKSIPRTVDPASGTEPQTSRLLLAAGDSGGDVTIYDVQSRATSTKCIGGYYQVRAMAFSPDGATLASGGRGPVKIWDVATGRLLLDFRTGDFISDLSFSPDGSRLAVAASQIYGEFYPRSVSVWALEHGRGVGTLRGLSAQIAKVCFSSDGRYIAALSHKWEIGIWDIAKAELLRVIEAPVGGFVDNAAILLDLGRERLAFAGDSSARVWDVQSGKELRAWSLPTGLCNNLVFSSQGRLLSFREDFLPDLRTNACCIRDLTESEPKLLTSIHDFKGGIYAASVSPDGRIFVVDGWIQNSNAQRRAVRAYDQTGKQLWEKLSGKTAQYGSLVPDPSGKLLAVYLDDAPGAVVVQVESGNVRRRYPWFPYAFASAADMAVASIHEHGCSLFYEPMETPAINLGVDQPQPEIVRLDASGNLLAWGNTDGTVTVCDLKEINARLKRINLHWHHEN